MVDPPPVEDLRPVVNPGIDDLPDPLCPGIDQAKIDCQNLLFADWLVTCHALVNVNPPYEDCILDLCLDPTDETAAEILISYLEDCIPVLPPIERPIPIVNPPLQCNWMILAGLDLPNCGKNMEYKQCVDSCEVETCLGKGY